jgi:hypothetical protein
MIDSWLGHLAETVWVAEHVLILRRRVHEAHDLQTLPREHKRELELDYYLWEF